MLEAKMRRAIPESGDQNLESFAGEIVSQHQNFIDKKITALIQEYLPFNPDAPISMSIRSALGADEMMDIVDRIIVVSAALATFLPAKIEAMLAKTHANRKKTV